MTYEQIELTTLIKKWRKRFGNEPAYIAEVLGAALVQQETGQLPNVDWRPGHGPRPSRVSAAH